MAVSCGTSQPVVEETDAQVEYKRVDLQSYEARNGASLVQSFKDAVQAHSHFTYNVLL